MWGAKASERLLQRQREQDATLKEFSLFGVVQLSVPLLHVGPLRPLRPLLPMVTWRPKYPTHPTHPADPMDPQHSIPPPAVLGVTSTC